MRTPPRVWKRRSSSEFRSHCQITDMEEQCSGFEDTLCRFEVEVAQSGRCMAKMRFSLYLKLGDQLAKLSADALELACSREAAGAMDLFEQANVALGRLGSLLVLSVSRDLQHSVERDGRSHD